MSGDDRIRPITGWDELNACIALQEETWGHGFSDRVPPGLLKVVQRLGGVAAGAWSAEGTLDGFVFGITGVEDGELVHWSDLLAVRPGVRSTGVGTSLKAYQRRVLLERGVRKVLWTFDPLRSKNAHINFSKLGIVVREYVLDMYGDTGSPLHRGIGTDRFIALWLLDSERVTARMADVEHGPGLEAARGVAAALQDTATAGELPRPGTPILELEDPEIRVAIPADISRIMSEALEVAVAWREATRRVFIHYLNRGYEVSEFFRGARTSDYLLTKRSTP